MALVKASRTSRTSSVDAMIVLMLSIMFDSWHELLGMCSGQVAFQEEWLRFSKSPLKYSKDCGLFDIWDVAYRPGSSVVMKGFEAGADVNNARRRTLDS
jgi:hypothetical protein